MLIPSDVAHYLVGEEILVGHLCRLRMDSTRLISNGMSSSFPPPGPLSASRTNFMWHSVASSKHIAFDV